MKKLLLAALLAIVSVGASAQIEQGMRFGVQAFAGYNSIGETAFKSAFSNGVGIIAEYNFTEKSYLSTGLDVANKGWKSDVFDKSVKVIYLTLPIHLGGRVNIGGDTYLHFQGGPQVSYGLKGSTIDFDIFGGETKYKDWGKRFELGAGAKVGVEFDEFQINLSGSYGFTKCMSNGGHNLNFSLGFAYIL